MAVREVVADHDQDERRHSAYFSRLLEFAWPRLDKEHRALIGPLLSSTPSASPLSVCFGSRWR